MIIDKNKLFSDLDAMGEKIVREKIALRAFHKDKISLVQEWLLQKSTLSDDLDKLSNEDLYKITLGKIPGKSFTAEYDFSKDDTNSCKRDSIQTKHG